MAAGSTQFAEPIARASRLYRIPEGLIRAVVQVESSYNPRVVSNKGAAGLMQLMPAVVRAMGVADPFDPEQNIMGGTRLLRLLANRLDGNLQLTLAAYNAGFGNVRKHGFRVPSFAEIYVRKVQHHYAGG